MKRFTCIETDDILKKTFNMQQSVLILDGITFPNNLSILKEQWNSDDWEIKPVYYLELKHGLFGFFPAIIVKDKRIILTQDKNLIERIWNMLTPRKSKMGEELFYINKYKPVGYQAQHKYGDKYAVVDQLLTEDEYQSLIKETTTPFEWAPGLIGDDMTIEEFIKNVDAATKTQH